MDAREQEWTESAIRARFPRLVEIIDEGISNRLHLGAQFSIRRGSEMVCDGAIGEAAPGESLSAGHLMPWLSCSKPLGAVAFALLWEAGHCHPDEPMANILPEFAQGGKAAVTWRHILTHTAGLPELPVEAKSAGPQPWDETVASICALPLLPGWEPGRRAAYQPLATWFVLGEAVSRWSAMPYADFVRSAILEPLGMDEAWMTMPRERLESYRNAGRLGILFDTFAYSAGKPLRLFAPLLAPLRADAGRGASGSDQAWSPENRISGTDFLPVDCVPGRSLFAPAQALVRLYAMLGGEGKLGDHRFLLTSTVREMLQRHREDMLDETLRHKVDYGLGFILNSNRYGADTVPYGFGRHASERAFGHGGSQSSIAFADPAHGLAVAAVFNGACGEPRHQKRNRAFCTALYEDLGLA